ncbi:hypothetical protein ACQ4PT_054997 [Festuca glaucescens]
MVMLRSENGVEFLLSEAEAINCGRTVYVMIKYDSESENHIIPSDAGEIKCRLVRVSVRGDTLSKVIHFSKMHTSFSGSHDDLRGWDADFVGGLDHETLFDLILASEYLQTRRLIDLVCQAIANKINGKSPREICRIFNIKSVFFLPELDDQEMLAKQSQDQLELEEKALRALDIVRCQEFTGYDPKVKAYVRTRFDTYNLAFFDLDKESDFCRGPLLHTTPSQKTRDSTVESCVNVVSLKVRESDVGLPVRVFGTVVARDQVDYRCVYLFRRGKEDPQLITSTDGMLALMDPCRGLVPADRIYFEIDLKIVHDGGEIEDFSKGVIIFNRVRLPYDRQTMAVGLNSYLSRVEIACAYVVRPVEATIQVNILKGPCNISRVKAWTSGNFEYNMILYHDETTSSREADVESGGAIVDGGFVPLSRRVVAVPFGRKLVVHLTGRGVGDAFARNLILPIGQSVGLIHRKMGSALVEVKVIWTAVPRRQRQAGLIKQVGDESLLM